MATPADGSIDRDAGPTGSRDAMSAQSDEMAAGFDSDGPAATALLSAPNGCVPERLGVCAPSGPVGPLGSSFDLPSTGFLPIAF